MRRKEWISLIILLLVIGFAIYRFKTRHFTESRTRILMGTLVEISLTDNSNRIISLVDEAFELMSDYDKKFSYYNEDGMLWQINNSESDSIAIDSDYFELLTLCDLFYEKSDGLYDVTISPLSKLWHSGRTTVPPPDSIAYAKSKVGFDKLEFGPDYLIMPTDMELDFGSIAKGFIIDRVVEFIEKHGVYYGYINAGGDLRVFGDSRKETTVGIQHPRDSSAVIAVLGITDRAVVTSGDYERFFEFDGVRYHHIINPLTGYPVKGIYSVTIIAPNATIADALATTAFLLNPEDAIELVKSFPLTDCIIYYDHDDEIISLRTQGVMDYIRQ